MNTEERRSFKKELLDSCIRHLEANMAGFKNEMDDAQKAANDYGAPKDRYDAFRNQQMRRKDMMAKQYQKALEQKELLLTIDTDKLLTEAVFGAVVMTSKQSVFVSSGLGKMNVQGKEIFAISPQVPFFGAIFQKREGDEFEFRGQKGKLLEVF